MGPAVQEGFSEEAMLKLRLGNRSQGWQADRGNSSTRPRVQVAASHSVFFFLHKLCHSLLHPHKSFIYYSHPGETQVLTAGVWGSQRESQDPPFPGGGGVFMGSCRL
jgi:hypothetical protein